MSLRDTWERFYAWLKNNADSNSVSYSRFGLPGDEVDDRPPPTQIHVAEFKEDAPPFMIFGVHSIKAAVITAGIGISITVFIFLSIFFEFDWYNNKKGIDISVLVGLVLFLLVGVAIHWQIVRGVKHTQPQSLVPFIIIYSIMILSELLFLILSLNQWVVVTYIQQVEQFYHLRALFLTVMFMVVIAVQLAMLFSVIRCRNYLEKKSIHEMEMRIAERAKIESPGLKIVVGGSLPPPHTSVADSTIISSPNRTEFPTNQNPA
ncbi:hypothetical protein WR25_09342 [Diploscapter pachys]|uniref:Uncharacterized protein n=1 Tax=Diploscapter pachys TaxID=2018661 RepID=A0A2A2L5A5_9BILA|nr:hypothetical protein WR25_09342 [Diploscapter pachys]